MTLLLLAMRGCDVCAVYSPRFIARRDQVAAERAARGLPPPRAAAFDIDASPAITALADRYRISNVPTTLLLRDDGSVAWRATGEVDDVHLAWLLAQV